MSTCEMAHTQALWLFAQLSTGDTQSTLFWRLRLLPHECENERVTLKGFMDYLMVPINMMLP